MESQTAKKTLKQKLFHEFSEYMINVIYLTVFFGAFAVARRLTLAHYDIYVDDYFIGLIKALVIGKVIMIGAFLRISRKFENRPLIIPVVFKTVLFVIWVIIFDVVEVLIKESIKLQSLTSAFQYLVNEHFSKLWLGGLIMVTLSFIPFFALKEISRVVGHEKFRNLLLKNRKELN
jgi:hypothetical protein